MFIYVNITRFLSFCWFHRSSCVQVIWTKNLILYATIIRFTLNSLHHKSREIICTDALIVNKLLYERSILVFEPFPVFGQQNACNTDVWTPLEEKLLKRDIRQAVLAYLKKSKRLKRNESLAASAGTERKLFQNPDLKLKVEKVKEW